MIPRIVVDTNIFVSAAITDRGIPAAVLNSVAAHRCVLCVSEAILAEYGSVLRRPKLHLDPLRVDYLLRLVVVEGVLVAPTRTVAESSDEPDNRFLECADTAEADYLVTGNARHFPQTHKRTMIVTGRRFLNILAELDKK
jgi:putative PIN family toxin of toxin-antitoxin system